MKAETRALWSRPIQASIDAPLDIFKVDVGDSHPGVQIRLEGPQITKWGKACEDMFKLFQETT